jgi:integral membrane sensor domain MASE1
MLAAASMLREVVKFYRQTQNFQNAMRIAISALVIGSTGF